MKICKNEFDTILYSVTKCSQCAFKTRRSSCLWLMVNPKFSITCGGIIQDTISDIFKL